MKIVLLMLVAGFSCVGHDSKLQTGSRETVLDGYRSDMHLDSSLQVRIDSIERRLIYYYDCQSKMRLANDQIASLELERKSATQAHEKAAAAMQKEFIKLTSLPGASKALYSSSGIDADSTALIASILEEDSLKLRQKIATGLVKAADTSKKDALHGLRTQLAVVEEKLRSNALAQGKLWGKYLGRDTFSVRKNDTLQRAINKVKDATVELEDWKKQLQLLQKRKETIIASREALVAELELYGRKLPSIVRVFDSAHVGDSGKVFFAFRFHGNYYRVFLASADKHRVDIFAAYKKPLSQQPLSASWDRMIKEKKTPVMVMNGGMYQQDGSPVGLYISDGLVRKPLDLDSQAKQDNFHMYPNGVFAIDTLGRFHVTHSRAFSQALKQAPDSFRYATQSGPMLVINDSIHPSFNYASVNFNIRNGVGVIEGTGNKLAVFLLSESEVNFFDMALLMKYVFGCRNALYFDGFVSRMYYEDGSEKYGDRGGALGPVIAVSKKIKSK